MDELLIFQIMTDLNFKKFSFILKSSSLRMGNKRKLSLKEVILPTIDLDLSLVKSTCMEHTELISENSYLWSIWQHSAVNISLTFLPYAQLSFSTYMVTIPKLRLIFQLDKLSRLESPKQQNENRKKKNYVY